MFIISKIIFDRENNFTQYKYNKLKKISDKNKCFFGKKLSAKLQKCKYGIIYSSVTWCRPDRYVNSKLIIKTYFCII